MAISQSQIMQRAFRIANAAGVEPHSSLVIDNQFTAEDLFPLALREAVKIGAGIEAEVNSLKRTHSIVLTAGEANLPDTVLEECLDSSSIYSTTDSTVAEKSSFVERYMDYLRSSYNQLSYYTTRGGKFCYRGAGQAAGISTATIQLVAVSLPDIPASLTTAMTITTELAERTIGILAKMLRGQSE